MIEYTLQLDNFGQIILLSGFGGTLNFHKHLMEREEVESMFVISQLLALGAFRKEFVWKRLLLIAKNEIEKN